MRTPFVRLAVVFTGSLTLALAAGCGNDARVEKPTASATEKANKPTAPSSEVAVRDVRAEELVATVSGYKDKVVVVDFWATWCAPCIKKFPHLVEMHRKYGDKGLVCVSVSMDKWEKAAEYEKKNGRAQVLEFLKAKDARFPNFIVSDADEGLKTLEAKFGEFAGIPHMAIFDKAGRKVWDSTNSERLTDAQLEQKIESELTK